MAVKQLMMCILYLFTYAQIGPIPVDDGIGKEIITEITTTMKTNRTFYIDSNGRDFIKRV